MRIFHNDFHLILAQLFYSISHQKRIFRSLPHLLPEPFQPAASTALSAGARQPRFAVSRRTNHCQHLRQLFVIHSSDLVSVRHFSPSCCTLFVMLNNFNFLSILLFSCSVFCIFCNNQFFVRTAHRSTPRMSRRRGISQHLRCRAARPRPFRVPPPGTLSRKNRISFSRRPFQKIRHHCRPGCRSVMAAISQKSLKTSCRSYRRASSPTILQNSTW